MALHAPIDRFTHHTLRAVVLELKEGERRRHFPFTMHVGVPGRSVRHVEDPRSPSDAGLRADLVLAMLQMTTGLKPRPCAWLTRPGELTLHDGDVPWASAVRWAAAATGTPLGLVVVTRRGWFDPETGVRREWRRLRRHHGRKAAAGQSQV
jgi:hypothetical protein